MDYYNSHYRQNNQKLSDQRPESEDNDRHGTVVKTNIIKQFCERSGASVKTENHEHLNSLATDKKYE